MVGVKRRHRNNNYYRKKIGRNRGCEIYLMWSDRRSPAGNPGGCLGMPGKGGVGLKNELIFDICQLSMFLLSQFFKCYQIQIFRGVGWTEQYASIDFKCGITGKVPPNELYVILRR